MFRSTYFTVAVACAALLLQLVVQSCASGDDEGNGGTGGISGTCGDGILAQDGTEQCDTYDLGGATCETLGEGSGSLGCNMDCTYDVSMCPATPVAGSYGG